MTRNCDFSLLEKLSCRRDAMAVIWSFIKKYMRKGHFIQLCYEGFSNKIVKVDMLSTVPWFNWGLSHMVNFTDAKW